MAGLVDVFAKLRTGAVSWGQRFKSLTVPALKVRPVEDPFPFKNDEDASRNHVRNHVVPGSLILSCNPAGGGYAGWTVGYAELGVYQSVMTQQITGFDYDFTIVGGSANAFTIALMRTPIALSLATMFAAPGDQTLLYSRTWKTPTEVADRKQFPFGFGAPSGWYCNVGEELRLTAFALTPGIHPVNLWVFGSFTLDFLQTFRQTVNR